MNYILVLVIYSILTPGVYSKKTIEVWPLDLKTCKILAKKSMNDPKLNVPTKYLTSATCIPVIAKKKVFPQTEI